MANRGDIKQSIKDMLTRSYTGMDTALDEYINRAVGLFGDVVTSVYDEREYEVTISQSDVDSNINNWQLPTNTKTTLSVHYVDVGGTEDVFYELELKSPIDMNNVRRFDAGGSYDLSAGGRFDYTSSDVTLPSWRSSRVSRVDREGIPRIAHRIGTNLYVYPRPGDDEVDNKLICLLGVKPAKLTDDSDTNSITDHHSDALIMYTTALFVLLKFKDFRTGQFWMQQAINHLQAFATADEIGKLTAVTSSKNL